VDGIFHFVRAFESEEVIHVDDSVDPIRDLETIQRELCLKDFDTLQKVLGNEKNRIRKEKGIARFTEPPMTDLFLGAYEKYDKLLKNNTLIQTGEFSTAEVDLIKDWERTIY